MSRYRSTLLLLIFLIFSLPAGAVTFTVTNLDDTGLGSLRQAILDANNAAVTDDTIVFQAGLSGLLLTSGGMTITGNLTIEGPGESLIINGNNAKRIFTVNSGVTANFSGLKLKNGGIENSGTLTLSNSTIQSTTWAGDYGAAIYNEFSMTLNNCVLSDNQSTTSSSSSRSVIYNNGTLTINNSMVSDNFSYGIKNAWILTINNSTVSDNSGYTGIYNSDWDAVLKVFNSTLSGNFRGIFNYGTATVRNSTLSNNHASDSEGGGIYNSDYYGGGGTLTVLNSTLSGNSATSGGGIYNRRGVIVLLIAIPTKIMLELLQD